MRVVIKDQRQIRAINEGRVVAAPLPNGGFVVATLYNSRQEGEYIAVESFPIEEGRGTEWNISEW